MQDLAQAPGQKRPLTTRISESELNSYLAFVLSQAYHPSLRDITLKFEEGRLGAVGTLDFARLEFNSTAFLNSVFRTMLSGVHTLTVRGKLAADSGKGRFELEAAKFDGLALPNLLVSEIITAVGRKQNPPLNPMEATTLPYSIVRVEVHPGYLLVVQ